MKRPDIRPTAFTKLHLRGKRIVLRPYRISDFKILRASHLGRQPSKNKFDAPVGIAEFEDLNSFKERIAKHRKNAKEGHHFVFGIFALKTEEYIGEIDVFTLNRQLRWGNLGYHIQNQHYGKGYGTEAGRLALAAAFEDLNFHRIESGMELDNKASRALALKIGMIAEGVRKKFFAHNGGTDMRFFAANAIAWKATHRS